MLLHVLNGREQHASQHLPDPDHPILISNKTKS